MSSGFSKICRIFDASFVRLFIVLTLFILPLAAPAAIKLGYEADKRQLVSLPIYKSGLIRLSQTPGRISVGNPDIADIVVLRGRQVHVVAKSLGVTNVVFWDKNDRIFATADVEVTHDLESLKAKLHSLLPNERIGVHSVQNQIVLDGQVSGAAVAQSAVRLAASYLPSCGAAGEGKDCGEGQVINMMSVGGAQQVMLEVKVAEMSRSFTRTLDADLNILNFGGSSGFGAVNGGASWDATTASIAGGSALGDFTSAAQSISDKGVFLSRLFGNNLFQVALEMSRSKGLSKVLAEPTLTTLTGKPAEFLSGGEYPVPVPSGDNTSIMYKEYGVGVKFIPTILDDNRINLELDIDVSEINSTSLVTVSYDNTDEVVVVPSLSKRSASSSVELRPGQTIGIAGLIQDNVSEVVSKLPGLGDLPVLGALFRSQEFISGQSELVIFVTPYLARPVDSRNVRLPTDSFVEPSDLGFYLFGKMEGDSLAKTVKAIPEASGGFDQVRFGHQL
ncbi:type II and III secretion system protein family protein [Granulosicoccaceae sp. 1_MG-2023]|nr:type II and III secretion system protein family protein [Granulosicoccaceae sp. 1_MG-2023]